MADVFTKDKRSEVMSKIRSKNTKPELLVRKYLFANGFRYRVHYDRLPGHPDIVLPKYKTVIFVNGCFWHKHLNCKFALTPKTNVNYWMEKINNNVVKDELMIAKLIQLGWKVITIWECELRIKKRTITLEKLKLSIE